MPDDPANRPELTARTASVLAAAAVLLAGCTSAGSGTQPPPKVGAYEALEPVMVDGVRIRYLTTGCDTLGNRLYVYQGGSASIAVIPADASCRAAPVLGGG